MSNYSPQFTQVLEALHCELQQRFQADQVQPAVTGSGDHLMVSRSIVQDGFNQLRWVILMDQHQQLVAKLNTMAGSTPGRLEVCFSYNDPEMLERLLALITAQLAGLFLPERPS